MKNNENNEKNLHRLLEITEKRKPDFNNLLKVLNKDIPDRPTLFEFFFNDHMYENLTGFTMKGKSFFDLNIIKMEAFRNAGFDYFTLSYPEKLVFKTSEHHTEKSISLNETVIIRTKDDFLDYSWPSIQQCDLTYFDQIKKFIPEGMKAIPYGPGGVLENVTQLLGYNNLCYMLYDDREFLKEVFDKVGGILLDYYQTVAGHDIVGAMIVNDDWGFNTQTMLSADNMREFVIPWHKKIADVIHQSGKKAILHSCGQLAEVMDDIIDYIGYDAKHSYEDNIMKVEDAYPWLQGRIAVLGGIDLDFIYKNDNSAIYERAKKMLELTELKGGYALGTGNSVPYYIENEKYYSLLLAALE
ncbi:MAG: hypothetical protein JXQ23_13030 [Clostridia bacterium]|nr:hypothetical protein [Clostridia bacterium]